jgi:hypothetical protein
VKRAHKNVTLGLPEVLLQQFRAYAASRNESMIRLMADAIHKMLDEDGAAKAKRRFIKRIHNAPDRGTGGVIRWTRDELH